MMLKMSIFPLWHPILLWSVNKGGLMNNTLFFKKWIEIKNELIFCISGTKTFDWDTKLIENQFFEAMNNLANFKFFV